MEILPEYNCFVGCFSIECKQFYGWMKLPPMDQRAVERRISKVVSQEALRTEKLAERSRYFLASLAFLIVLCDTAVRYRN